MDITTILNAAREILPANVFQKGLQFMGILALCKDAVPKLLTWGTPAMANAADWLAKVVLNSPARSLILYFAPNIIAFLDSLSSAIDQLVNTFTAELTKDIQAAAVKTPAVVDQSGQKAS